MINNIFNAVSGSVIIIYFKQKTMRKCKWFGHKWGEWKAMPDLSEGLNGSLREHQRVCKRCKTIDRKYIY